MKKIKIKDTAFRRILLILAAIGSVLYLPTLLFLNGSDIPYLLNWFMGFLILILILCGIALGLIVLWFISWWFISWLISQGIYWALSKETTDIFDWTDTVLENLGDFWYNNFELIKQ